ncbi:MAG TPA: hypothetical protein VIA80_17150 [Hyphomonadaceae bacterium]
MKRSLAVLSLTLAVPVASAQAPASDLVGIYTSITVTGPNPVLGILRPGERVTNELVVYDNLKGKEGSLRAFVKSVTPEGVSCQIEGDVAKASAEGFSVSETMFGVTCSLTIVREGDGLRVSASSSQCSRICGEGGSFLATPYKKLCSTVEPSVLEDMTSRIYAKDPDYGPACKP